MRPDPFAGVAPELSMLPVCRPMPANCAKHPFFGFVFFVVPVGATVGMSAVAMRAPGSGEKGAPFPIARLQKHEAWSGLLESGPSMRTMLLIIGLLATVALAPPAQADAACLVMNMGLDFAVKCKSQTVGSPTGHEIKTEEFCIGDSHVCNS